MKLPDHHLKSRLDSIDLLRGLVMAIMALDHVRDFFSKTPFDALDLTQTNTALFFTRWVTHFCAPTFIFFAGTSAFLSGAKGKPKGELFRFLLTRGLWLIFLELTVVLFAWLFSFKTEYIFSGVIWTIGFSLIFLALVLRLSLKTLSILSISLIFFHNLTDTITPETFGPMGWVWKILHVYDSSIYFTPNFYLYILYPLIPWIGVLTAGYCLGPIFLKSAPERKRTLTYLGAILVALFVILRGLNGYGDPTPWTLQPTLWFTVLSFLECEKYPPSLLFLLMTLGPAILILPLLEKWKGTLAQFFITLGRVPLFYYVLHLFWAHALSYLFVKRLNLQFDLLGTYGVWLFVVLSLYPLCYWFAGVKRRSKNPWLSYL